MIRPVRIAYAAAIVMVVAACHKKDAGSCRTEAADLAQFLAHVEHAPDGLAIGSTKLVERGALPLLASVDAPVVVVRGAVTVSGHEVSTDAVGTDLVARAPGGHGYVLAVDAAEPWSKVVAVIGSAGGSGFDHVQLVFAHGGGDGSPPPRTPVDDELDAAFASGRASDLAALAKRTVTRCPALQATFGAVEPAGHAGDVILSGLAPALIDCECNVDMSELRSILYRLYAGPRPVGVLALVVTADAPPVRLPASTTWADASKQLSSPTASFGVL
jgi:hypothetical protein